MASAYGFLGGVVGAPLKGPAFGALQANKRLLLCFLPFVEDLIAKNNQR